MNFVSSYLYTKSRNTGCMDGRIGFECAGHLGIVYSMNRGPFHPLMKPFVGRPRHRAVFAICNISQSAPKPVSKV